MKKLLVVLLVIAFAAPAMARDLTGSYVTLVDPLFVNPGETYTFTFYVWNNSPDVEWIADISIVFGGFYECYEATMGHDHASAVFDMTVEGTSRCWWKDGDGGYGEIYDGEGCHIWVDATVPVFDSEDTIMWELYGDIWGDPPHYVTGCIDLAVTGVEESTWSAIKAMFR
jgi:hypothetical protein